jgi:hypothetical protein
MRLLTGRPSLHLLSLLLLLSLRVSPLPLYLRLFFFPLFYLTININIIQLPHLQTIVMATGQELIRLGEGRVITSVNDIIRYLSTIPKALRFIY